MEKNELLIIYGEDLIEMTIKLAQEAHLAQLIGERSKRIGIKPNLVVSRPACGGATTHPALCKALVNYLHSNGFYNITIMEGSWTGDSTTRAFTQCGYTQFCTEEKVTLIDTQKDRCRSYNCAGVDIAICDSAMNVDFMINVPVLKGHCQTLLTCALKNNKGLIPDREKRRFHTIGLHKPIAHLNIVVRNDFILVDGVCGDPHFETGGNPVYVGRLIAARDPVLVDAWAALQMGYAAGEIPYIGIAEKLGIGCADPQKAIIRELSAPMNSSRARPAAQSGKARQFTRYIQESDACSSCYASLIFALSRLSAAELGRIQQPVCIGQGFKGGAGAWGIGQCTSGFTSFCPGCPPSGAEALAFLERTIRRISRKHPHRICSGAQTASIMPLSNMSSLGTHPLIKTTF